MPWGELPPDSSCQLLPVPGAISGAKVYFHEPQCHPGEGWSELTWSRRFTPISATHGREFHESKVFWQSRPLQSTLGCRLQLCGPLVYIVYIYIYCNFIYWYMLVLEVRVRGCCRVSYGALRESHFHERPIWPTSLIPGSKPKAWMCCISLRTRIFHQHLQLAVQFPW